MVNLNTQIYNYKVNKAKGYVDKEEITPSGFHRFDLGECDAGPDKRITFDINASLVKRYPESYHKVKELIAKRFKTRQDLIVIGPGLNEIIERITAVFLNNGDKVLILNPTFFRFEDACRRRTNNVKHIYLKEETGFSLTENALRDIMRETNEKLIWLCNPVNPTGKLLPLDLIEEIVKSKPQTLVIVDEAYLEYVDDYERFTALQLLSRYDNLVVLRTVSKFYGLAGIRFGYAFSCERVINALKSIQLEFDVSAPTLHIAEQFFTIQDPSESNRGIILAEKERIESALLQIKSIKHVPSNTGILLVKHNTKRTYLELLKHNILTADMNTCRGIRNLNYVRVTVQTDKAKNDILLCALRKMDGESNEDSNC